jgi:hypothetical protein
MYIAKLSQQLGLLKSQILFSVVIHYIFTEMEKGHANKIVDFKRLLHFVIRTMFCRKRRFPLPKIDISISTSSIILLYLTDMN